MGKTPGRPKPGKLADMTVHPQRKPLYQPPPKEECVEETWPLAIGAEDELRCRWSLWRETYKVDFAIVQVVRADGGWWEIARIDCEHGDVHHHQLYRAKPKDTLGTRVRLQLIPVKRGWETVDKWYGQALTLMLDQWQESKRKWGGDCE